MSCVVAYAGSDGVWLGADSAGTAQDLSQDLYATPKVFRIYTDDGHPIDVGYVGSYRLGQLIKYFLSPRSPNEGESDEHYLVTGLLPELQSLLRDTGFISQGETGREQGGSLLVGFRRRIYIVQEEFDLLEPLHPYAAIGEGAQVALGAMWVLSRGNIGARELVISALEAAASFCATVRPPYVLLSPDGALHWIERPQ